MRWYFVGVDLGQSEDYTALAVVEWRETAGEFDVAHWEYVSFRQGCAIKN